MGGRGGASGFSVEQQLRIMRKNNQFPGGFAGDPEQQNKVLRAINKTYDYPADLKQYMNSTSSNGLKNVSIGTPSTDRQNPQRENVSIRAGSTTLIATYTRGANDTDTTAIREGAVKFSLINWWKRQGHILSF